MSEAILALADGTLFRGHSFGAACSMEKPRIGEVVFNTSMYGYQEILTDPSYRGQILCFTAPHIGNVGCNPLDVESNKVHVEGVVVRDLSRTVSNFRATQSLSEYLEAASIPGLAGIDTRKIVAHLRNHGSQMGALASGRELDTDALVRRAREASTMVGQDLVQFVACKKSYDWRELPWTLKKNCFRSIDPERLLSRPHVVAIDCGVKYNILRLLLEIGFRVTVVPARFSEKEIQALHPDALFLSNGPGDPEPLEYVVKTVKSFLGRVPIFGICLGHQVLGQALGGKTYKLKFGHRGGNHPVKDLNTGKVEITVQNHGFAVDGDTLPGSVTVSHLNLNDDTVEGLEAPEHRAFSVQYHPEASPGPHDSRYLFQRFYDRVVEARA